MRCFCHGADAVGNFQERSAPAQRDFLTLRGNAHREFSTSVLSLRPTGRCHALSRLHRTGPSDRVHVWDSGGDSFAATHNRFVAQAVMAR